MANPSIEKIKPDACAFKYNPAISDLTLGIGLGFSFNFRSQKFELDQNPFGDPNLVPMNNVAVSDDFSQITFDARYQRKQRQFVMTAANECHKIMFELFARVNATGFTIADSDADHVELHFEQGRLSLIQIHKRPKPLEDLVDWLDIVREADRYCLLKQRPRSKVDLKSVTVDEHKLISRSADEEFVYPLDVQPVILETVKRLIASSSPA